MDDAAPNDSELLHLLSTAWDKGLDEAARARLEQLLAQNDFAAIEQLTSLTRLHLDLEWLVSSKSAQEKALASLRINHAGPTQASNAPLRGNWRLMGLCTLAAAVAIWGVCAWLLTPIVRHQLVRPPQAVGEVTRLIDAEWRDGTRRRIGDAVVNGEAIDLLKGSAQVSMGFGADILLQAPCRARILSSGRVALEDGELAVRAAKWAVGFKVDTPDLVATDLGTWFSVATGNGPSEIHVLEGLVSAAPAGPTNLNDTRRVTANQAIEVTRGGMLRPIQFRRDPAAEELAHFQPLRPIEIWNTGVGVQVGDVDPHWKVVAGESPSGPFPRSAIVCDPHGSYGVNEPDRSQWISVDRGTADGVPARSRYTFETSFDLTGFELNSVWVSGLILADDGVDEIWLNGVRLNIPPWKDWGYGAIYNRFHPVQFRSGFVAGVNRLAIVVKNETFIERSERGFDLPETPNPMALRAEWRAFGRPVGSNAVAGNK